VVLKFTHRYESGLQILVRNRRRVPLRSGVNRICIMCGVTAALLACSPTKVGVRHRAAETAPKSLRDSEYQQLTALDVKALLENKQLSFVPNSWQSTMTPANVEFYNSDGTLSAIADRGIARGRYWFRSNDLCLQFHGLKVECRQILVDSNQRYFVRITQPMEAAGLFEFKVK
jgi:hypothetical protein